MTTFWHGLNIFEGYMYHHDHCHLHHRCWRIHGENLGWRKNDVTEFKSCYNRTQFCFWLFYHALHHDIQCWCSDAHHHNIQFWWLKHNLLMLVACDYISIHSAPNYIEKCAVRQIFWPKMLEILCKNFHICNFCPSPARAHIQRSSNGYPNLARLCQLQAFKIILGNHAFSNIIFFQGFCPLGSLLCHNKHCF